jgi:MscS family membrane protein
VLGVRAPAQERPPEPPAKPADPLGRDSPRGTALGFMAASRDGKTEIAAQYLNSNLKGQSLAGLSDQLYVVLNGRLPVRLNVLSDRPEGSLANPLTPDRDIVGTIPTSSGELDIVVERVRAGNAAPVWLFARTTLERIPEVYREVDLVEVDRFLPRFLTHRIAGIRLFEWLSIFVLIPVLYRLLDLLNVMVRPAAVWLCHRAGVPPPPATARVPGAIRLLLLALLIHWVIPSVDFPLAERRLWAGISGLIAIAGFVWLGMLVTDYAERRLLRRVKDHSIGESRALIRLGRRVVEILVVAAGCVATLAYIGIDPTAALAGLGIGGIAVALAAQKTLENVIGGFSIVFDKAVRVGDVLKLGETQGTVDRVGLRSTRIRTLDRTIVTVPNGQIATANIETLSDRDKFWFRHVVGLTYATTASQMRTVSTGIHDLLLQHRSAEPESVRVRFFRLGPSSLDIEVVAYFFAADWVAFTAIQQDLLLRVMEIVEAAGTQIAFPTQTVQFVDDRASSEAWTPLRPERGTPREPSPAGAEAKAYANGKVVST